MSGYTPDYPSYILNLDRRPERLASTLEILSTIGFAPVRVPGLDGNALAFRDGSCCVKVKGCCCRVSWHSRPEDPPWARARLGGQGDLLQANVRIQAKRSVVEAFTVASCSLGHVEMLKRFLEDTTAEYCYIFEDDLQLKASERHFKQRLQACLDRRFLYGGKKLERVHFGGCGSWVPPHLEHVHARKLTVPKVGLKPGHFHYGTHAYLVSRRLAAEVIPWLLAGFSADGAFVKQSRIDFEDATLCWLRFDPPLLQQNRRIFGTDILFRNTGGSSSSSAQVCRRSQASSDCFPTATSQALAPPPAAEAPAEAAVEAPVGDAVSSAPAEAVAPPLPSEEDVMMALGILPAGVTRRRWAWWCLEDSDRAAGVRGLTLAPPVARTITKKNLTQPQPPVQPPWETATSLHP